jgi:hypothetical protein
MHRNISCEAVERTAKHGAKRRKTTNDEHHNHLHKNQASYQESIKTKLTTNQTKMENQQPRLCGPPHLQRQAMSAEDMDVPDIEANAVTDATSNILADAAARTPATTLATTPASPARNP